MLFRLRAEDFVPPDAGSRKAQAPSSAGLNDLSPEEWRIVNLILRDHRLYGEALAAGDGPAARTSRQAATQCVRRR